MQSISPGLSCRATEIIPLADISDVYNVSTGSDVHEFIIRRNRHGVTTYFTSTQRDMIVKVCSSMNSALYDDLLAFRAFDPLKVA